MPRSRTSCSIVLVTLPSKKSALALAKTVIEKNLAACANISGPVTSLFQWEGKLTKANEYVLSLKTTARKTPALLKAVEAEHPYDCPCIVAIDIADGHEAYLAWVRESVL